MDYTIFYKDSYDNGDLTDSPNYDVFLSAFDNCNRTNEVFSRVKSAQKKWFIFPQYRGIKKEEFPAKNVYIDDCLTESEYFENFIQEFIDNDYKTKKNLH